MEKYNKYKIPISNETMDEICNKKLSYELLPQQKFLAEYLFDNQHINGLLIYHQIGSGKNLFYNRNYYPTDNKKIVCNK